MKNLMIAFFAFFLLTSCNDWNKNRESDFKQQCLNGFSGYQTALPEIKAQMEASCDCAFEEVSKNYSFDEFTSGEYAQEIYSILESCRQSPGKTQSNNSKSAWSKEEIDAKHKECSDGLNAMGGTYSAEQIKSYCNCATREIEANYTPESFEKSKSSKSMADLFMACAEIHLK